MKYQILNHIKIKKSLLELNNVFLKRKKQKLLLLLIQYQQFLNLENLKIKEQHFQKINRKYKHLIIQDLDNILVKHNFKAHFIQLVKSNNSQNISD